ncbi:hypothetical protein [Prosthecobacter sp.]|uniref:hypothetical protein n=1 Tax=Prosthecobacter sp. TaxID=1965333 RepID=UPI00378422D5
MTPLPRCFPVSALRACRVLGVLSLLWVAGCGRKDGVVPVVEAAKEESGGAMPLPGGNGAEMKGGEATQQESTAMPKAKEQPAAAPLVLSQELENAAVVVRVTVAQTLSREQTGVLLRPESFVQSPVPGESHRRLVAVLLPAYDEAALRDPGCVIHVLRRKLDDDGRPFVMRYPGAVAHFDAKSHAAVVQFSEEFAYRLDGGVSQGPDAGAAGLYLLAAGYEMPPTGQPKPRLPVLNRRMGAKTEPSGAATEGTVGVTLLPVRLQEGTLRLEPETLAAVPRVRVAVVLDSEGRLAGHASRKTIAEESWTLQAAVVPPTVEEQHLLYVPESVDTGVVQKGTSGPGQYLVKVKGLLKDPMRELGSMRVAVQTLPTRRFPLAADVRKNQPPISHSESFLHVAAEKDGSFHFMLRLPENAKNVYQLVQLQLMRRGSSSNDEPAFHAAPFMVVTATDEAGSRPEVLGLGGLAGAAGGVAANTPGATPLNTTAPNSTAPGKAVSAEAAAAVGGKPAPLVPTTKKMLTTESRIVYGVPICEGREMLLRLEGAPHWKRLSLAEGKWLPLPGAAEDLALCHLAGNKEALFVLHPGLREIRRHHAGTLALEKMERLPDGMSYQGVAAGCLTAAGPVAVMTDAGPLACDPHELRVQPTPNLEKDPAGKLPPEYTLHSAGDGGAVWAFLHGKNVNEDRERTWRYDDAVVGYSQVLSTYLHGHPMGRLPTMTATAPWDRQVPGTDVCGCLSNSPNFFLISGNGGEYGPRPKGAPRCTLYSRYVDDPWAVVELPEAGDVPREEWRTFEHRVWMDTASLTLAVWHAPRGISLHTLEKAALPPPAAPVLLNYPDCHVPRGGSFSFTPQVLGGGTVEAAVSTPPEGLTEGAGGTLHWQVPQDMLPEYVCFGLKLTRQGQGSCEVPVQLRLGGQKPLVAVSPSLSGPAAEKAVADLGRNQKPGMPMVPLSFRHHFSSSPIERVMPGLNDYVALRLRNRALVLLTVKDWQVAGSCMLAEKDCTFMAGDAVFIYNTETRLLSRYAVPGFAVTHRMPMPGKARLFGLGTGVTPAGPLTLLQVEKVPINKPGYPADMMTDRISVKVLEKQTMSLGRWAPYNCNLQEQWRPESIIGSLLPMDAPAQIPCSNDGRLLNFPHGLVLISPGVTVDFNYYRSPHEVANWASWNVHLGLGSEPGAATTASPMGGRMFMSGHIFFNNYPAFKVAEWTTPSAMSTCGNYIACVKTTTASRTVPETGQEITLYSAADGRPLLNLAGLDLLRLRDDINVLDPSEYEKCPLVTAMGDKNLLVLLSRGGTVAEAVNLDFERVCRMVNPATACTTSHPAPVVAEGRTLEYQVTVNNPDAVSGYELQDTTPGAAITPQGLLTFQAPDGLEESQQIKISIRIRFTNGETAVQTFPIYVIALKAEAAAARKAQQERDAAMGIKKA